MYNAYSTLFCEISTPATGVTKSRLLGSVYDVYVCKIKF